MQVCTSFQTDNHASTSPLRFLQAGCPSCRPTNSVKALKAISSGDTAVLFRCEPVEAAAAEFSRRVDGEVLTVEERRRRCVDETQRVAAERRQFVDTVEKTADVIRQTVSHVVTRKPSQ